MIPHQEHTGVVDLTTRKELYVIPQLEQIDAIAREWVLNNLGIVLQALELFPNIP
ncbi:hypothetical protein [Hoyosella rhizosphaerae]|uniref:Uncharacterized protein n=1 Tax=Hoyosella rhizosphaerae TaxID=1755582 RepID=A0A916XDC2_9ACTN|nr:hypothetical protein [Hoyosella rhizosphaerae]GGC65264.1 hypothetical protein GCM10011410_17200 [Hoyosella rhizosphaerae]